MATTAQKTPEFKEFVVTANAIKGGEEIAPEWLLDTWMGADCDLNRALNHVIDTDDSKIRRAVTVSSASSSVAVILESQEQCDAFESEAAVHGGQQSSPACTVKTQIEAQKHQNSQTLPRHGTTSEDGPANARDWGSETLLSRHWADLAPMPAGMAAHRPFTICCWNVMADGLAQSQFPDRTVLEFPVRSQNLVLEISRIDADILCLCEINHMEDFYKPTLANLGYTLAAYVHKQEWSLFADYGVEPDGCAIFCRPPFQLEKDLSFTYDGSNHNAALVMLKDTRVSHDEFKGGCADKPEKLLVGLTHLKAGGIVYETLRLTQMKQLLTRVEAALGTGAADYIVGKDGSVTVSSEGPYADPENQDDFHNVVTIDELAFQGLLAHQRPALVLCGDWNDPAGGPVEKLVRSMKAASLRGAYAPPFLPPRFTAQDLAATWCTEDIPGLLPGSWMGCFDYMYHSPRLFTQTVFREPAFEDTVRQGPRTGIPNADYPSDHVALAATMCWCTS